jgi:phosphate-selective porin OprO/OprP
VLLTPVVLAQEEAAAPRTKTLEQQIEELRQRQLELERLLRETNAGEAQDPPAGAVAGAGQVTRGNGFTLESPDGKYRLSFRSMISLDAAVFDLDEALEARYGEVDNGVEVRRARLTLLGAIRDRVEFKTSIDFGGGDVRFKDVYVGMTRLPVLGRIRAGYMKEPFGLDEQTGRSDVTFVERAVTTEAFVPARDLGILLHDSLLEERMTWSAGAFLDADDLGSTRFDENSAVTARLTAVPWVEDDGRMLLHLGLAYRHIFVDEEVRFTSRLESTLAPEFIDSGPILADRADVLGFEAAQVLGPFSAQGEYVLTVVKDAIPVNGTDNSHLLFSSSYVQASCFLTGEHRRYDMHEGEFRGIRLARSVGEDGGFGAWELAARYSRLDLDSQGLSGGRLESVTFGLNWYLFPELKLMWNYGISDVRDLGRSSIFQMRIHLDF